MKLSDCKAAFAAYPRFASVFHGPLDSPVSLRVKASPITGDTSGIQISPVIVLTLCARRTLLFISRGAVPDPGLTRGYAN